MNKYYTIAEDKLIVTDENGNVKVLPNTTSNLRKKMMENDLQVLKEKLKKYQDDYINYDSKLKVDFAIIFSMILITIISFVSGSELAAFISCLAGIPFGILGLSQEKKRETINKKIRWIKSTVSDIRTEYMKECLKQKEIDKIEKNGECLVGKFNIDESNERIECSLRLISLYENYKKKFLKYYRKNGNLCGLNFENEYQRMFVERIISNDLGIDTTYDDREKKYSLVRK